jgi:hypothetical protein
VISVVNGFLCTCSCDASKAKRGVYPKADDAQSPAKPEPENVVVTDDKSAATFGGR